MTFEELKTRAGTFTISRRKIQEHPEEIIELLSGILIYKAETAPEWDSIKYYGFSRQFEKLDVGAYPAYYKIEIATKILEDDCVYKGRKRKKGDRVVTEINFAP